MPAEKKEKSWRKINNVELDNILKAEMNKAALIGIDMKLYTLEIPDEELSRKTPSRLYYTKDGKYYLKMNYEPIANKAKFLRSVRYGIYTIKKLKGIVE